MLWGLILSLKLLYLIPIYLIKISIMAEQFLSKEKVDELKNRLKELQTTKRFEIAER